MKEKGKKGRKGGRGEERSEGKKEKKVEKEVSFNKDIDNTEKNQMKILELKNTKTDNKISLGGLNSII